MALPNFRLFDTQARWSVYLAAVGTLGLFMLGYLVFRNFHWETRHILFNPDSRGMGRYRVPLIFLGTAGLTLLGVASAWLGYNSLGERRNQFQAWSWAGMLAGGLVSTVALLLFVAWQFMNVQVVLAN